MTIMVTIRVEINDYTLRSNENTWFLELCCRLDNLPVLTVAMASVKFHCIYLYILTSLFPSVASQWTPWPMQSQCILIEFTIKWVTQTDNEAIIMKCNKCNHGGNPGGCEHKGGTRERVHLTREHQRGLAEGWWIRLSPHFPQCKAIIFKTALNNLTLYPHITSPVSISVTVFPCSLYLKHVGSCLKIFALAILFT